MNPSRRLTRPSPKGRRKWPTIAGAYAWDGDRDKAFQWLDRAYKQRDGCLADIKFDPVFDSLRGDPRFRAFLRRMRLPE